jgi:hypothetical protein
VHFFPPARDFFSLNAEQPRAGTECHFLSRASIWRVTSGRAAAPHARCRQRRRSFSTPSHTLNGHHQLMAPGLASHARRSPASVWGEGNGLGKQQHYQLERYLRKLQREGRSVRMRWHQQRMTIVHLPPSYEPTCGDGLRRDDFGGDIYRRRAAPCVRPGRGLAERRSTITSNEGSKSTKGG